jgi:hypothetical protein
VNVTFRALLCRTVAVLWRARARARAALRGVPSRVRSALQGKVSPYSVWYTPRRGGGGGAALRVSLNSGCRRKGAGGGTDGPQAAAGSGQAGREKMARSSYIVMYWLSGKTRSRLQKPEINRVESGSTLRLLKGLPVNLLGQFANFGSTP